MSALLVIEDDPAIRAGLVAALDLDGHVVTACADFASGLSAARRTVADLVLLDLVLPGGDGLDILAEIRRTRPELPVILLTARGAETDRVRGLTAGADDYVVKPFGVAELRARIAAVLRRAGGRKAPAPETLTVGQVTFDLGRHAARRADGVEVGLTAQEAELVRLLAAHTDRVLARDELTGLLWRSAAPVQSRTLDMLVLRLRDKLGDDAAQPQVLVTVRGLGYRLGRQ
jgi:DNA-binding response OmpR family regulator